MSDNRPQLSDSTIALAYEQYALRSQGTNNVSVTPFHCLSPGGKEAWKSAFQYVWQEAYRVGQDVGHLNERQRRLDYLADKAFEALVARCVQPEDVASLAYTYARQMIDYTQSGEEDEPHKTLFIEERDRG
jgi:hypothetical protein